MWILHLLCFYDSLVVRIEEVVVIVSSACFSAKLWPRHIMIKVFSQHKLKGQRFETGLRDDVKQSAVSWKCFNVRPSGGNPTLTEKKSEVAGKLRFELQRLKRTEKRICGLETMTLLCTPRAVWVDLSEPGFFSAEWDSWRCRHREAQLLRFHPIWFF